MDILVFVPVAVGIVFALIQLLKQVGITGPFAALLELLLGLAFTLTGVLSGAITVETGDLPVTAKWFWACVYGLIVGLSAAGVYTDKKTATAPNA